MTAEVVMVNVAEFAPAATVTDVGVCAALLLLESVTDAPPVGAGPLSVTVPVEDAPPVSVVGLSVSSVIDGGLTVIVADLAMLLYEAEIADVLMEPTALVLTVNVPLMDPEGTVTEAGTVATPVLLLVKAATAPPAGAGPLKVSEAVEVLPPVSEAGLSVILLTPTAVVPNAWNSANPMLSP